MRRGIRAAAALPPHRFARAQADARLLGDLPADAARPERACACCGRRAAEAAAVRTALPFTIYIALKLIRVRRFRVKKWNAVAVWSWNVLTDTCAICRNNLHEPSIEYQAQVRFHARL